MVDKSIQDRLFELRYQYTGQLSGKIKTLQLQWGEIFSTPINLTHFPEFRRQLHNLRGTAGTYGCPEVSELAAEVESLLEGTGQENHFFDALLFKRVSTLLDKLVDATELCVSRANSLSSIHSSPVVHRSLQPSNKPVIYIVDDDKEYCVTISERLKQYGDCHSYYSKASFTEAINLTIPDVVIMDMMLPEGDMAGAEAANALLKKQRVPVIFVSTRDDESSRLAAVRAGAYGYFIKQDDPARMISMLDQLIARTPQNPYKLLMIDDDVELSIYYKTRLEGVGIQVSVLNSPVGAMARLNEISPDIILLDISMPEINGLELGSLIRQYPDYNHIPIIYLSASSSEKVQLEAMRLGGDDFLTKPVNPEYLCNVLLARLARVRVTRKGELKLQESLRELGYLQQGMNSHSIVSIADVAGRIIFANDKFSEITGYTEAELMGQNHRIIKSGLHDREFYEEMWRCISSGKIWNGEIANRKKNGELYWVLTTIIPILDDYGMPQRYLSVRTDVTPIKLLNEALAIRQNKLSLALSATHTGIWEWNIQTSETSYDTNWCGLLGYAEGQHPSWPQLIHPDDFQQCFSQFMKLLSDESGIYMSEHRKLNASGIWDWVQESGRVVERDDGGNPCRIMGTMQIINERKEAEFRNDKLREQLSQSAKMESVGHLAAGIAHDFNNILGAMLGYIEMSLMMLGNNEISVEKLERYLRMMLSSGTRAKELVAQMLTFSRLSPEGKDGNVPVILIAPIVKEVVSLLRSSVPSSINLNYHTESEDIKICIQPVHLHQIILNLGINARDAMAEFGKLDISLSRDVYATQLCASCKNTFSGEYAKIEVKDNGCGISEQVINKIFDPFFTTKGVGKGTGMGLSVVHGLVHALGGHIQVQSNHRDGTTISILLPIVVTESGSESVKLVEAQQSINIKGARIMVVDDERSMTTMLYELMTIFGAEIVAYNDPLQALEDFSSNTSGFDLVMTDETMPGMSGLQLAEQMLKLRPELPIILCTGYSAETIAEKAAAIGVASLFLKPLKMNELLAKVQELLGSRKF